MKNLPAILRRNRGDEVRVNDAALHQVDRSMVEIILQPILMIEVRVAVQAGGAEDVFSRHALMLHVVQRETDTRMLHAEMLINLVEQHRHEGGLPVVTVDHVGMLATLEHELQRGATEESEALVVVLLAVERAAVEKIVIAVCVNEVALAPVDKAEEHGAMNRAAIPRHPQILIRDLQPVNLVVIQAIVFREDDLDGVAANFQFTGKTEDDIAQPAHFGDRCALGCDLDDVHALVGRVMAVLKTIQFCLISGIV